MHGAVRITVVVLYVRGGAVIGICYGSIGGLG